MAKEIEGTQEMNHNKILGPSRVLEKYSSLLSKRTSCCHTHTHTHTHKHYFNL